MNMKLTRVGFLVLALLALTVLTAHADNTLGTAYYFAVLAGSAITNTGNTVITGDLGVYPGTAISGFPPGIVNGTIHDADAVAQQAQADALTAYNYFGGLPFNQNLTGQDLGGKTSGARPRGHDPHTGSLFLFLVRPIDGHADPEFRGNE